jgi:hypothetical protein
METIEAVAGVGIVSDAFCGRPARYRDQPMARHQTLDGLRLGPICRNVAAAVIAGVRRHRSVRESLAAARKA